LSKNYLIIVSHKTCQIAQTLKASYIVLKAWDATNSLQR